MTRSVIKTTLAALMIAAVANPEPTPGLSHLEARMAADDMSHLGAHRPGLPPEALLVPLGNGLDGVIKGLAPPLEARLVDSLARERLTEMVLRVAAARAAGRSMALVKLQAGSRDGSFSIGDLQADAAACLRAAFTPSLRLDHVDLWAVVPGAGLIGDQQEHHPVFSVSLSREEYSRAVAEAGGDGPEVLEALDAVRYSPLFARYAADSARTKLPATALTEPALAQSWDALLSEASGPHVQAQMARQDRVEAIFNGSRAQCHVAQKVEQFPALALMTAEAGHELANHAYSNRRMSDLSAAEAWAEIVACDRAVQRVTGERMRWFRPPGGRCSPGGLRAVASLGHAAAFWSRNTGDWRKPPAGLIVHNATQDLEAGDIILMHQGEICSVEALPEIIDRIRAMGLEPTTLSALEHNGGTVRDDPVRVSTMVNGQLGPE
ncbi:MAG: polysaccharide deacetylase family protein [Armatimonadota bacterium]